MLNSGKSYINILTLVLSDKKILNETKNHNPPPFQVKWSVPNRQDKIAAVLYNLLYFMHIQHWVCCIEKLLNDCGLSEYWLTQNVPKNVILSKIVKQRLCDQFKQSWSESVFTSAQCLNYRIFKCIHQLENSLVQLPYDLRKAYCNYRCLNHRLPIEKGRF
jgi:hypothetical protein